MFSTDSKCPVCQRLHPLHSASVLLPKKLWSLDAKKIVRTDSLCNNCLKDAESYCCISYVWSKFDNFFFRLHGYRINKDGNAQKINQYNIFFSNICKKFQASFIWFDKLCLPDNPDELGSEIMLMGEYYHKARLCIALLDRVMDEADIFHTLEAGKVRRWLFTRGDDDFWYYRWAVEKLNSNGMCEDSWFERVWTAQEFCRSQHCIAWDGHNSINLTRLAAIFLSLEANDPVAIKKGLSDLPPPFTETMLLWRDSFFNQLDLATALWMTTQRKCTLEEDRIYGILGLLKHPLKFSVAYNIGLDNALLRASKAALEIGDLSILTAIHDNANLFPSYNILCSRSKPLRLGNIGQNRCILTGKGISLSVIRQAHAASVVFGEENTSTDFHIRVYLSVLHWLAFLAELIGARALPTLIDCFSPSEKETPKLMEWFKECINCSVEEESIRNLCIDMPDKAFFTIGRRLLRDHQWALIDLENKVDGIHPRFVLASLVNIQSKQMNCLFLDVPVLEDTEKLLFLVCTENNGTLSRIGYGVCNGYRNHYPATTKVTIT